MTKFTSDVEAANGLASSYQKLKTEISKVVIGQDEVVRHGYFLSGPFAAGWRSGSCQNIIGTDHRHITGTSI